MKGLVYRGPRDIRYEAVADPEILDDRDIIVAVRCCSICGSDLHIYDGDTFSDATGYCVGHEAVGEVVEVGKGVRQRRVGERVMLPAAVGCGSCSRCLAGDILRCERDLQSCYGLSPALQGSQADAVRVPAGDFNAYAIPDGLTDEQALMLTDAAPTAWYGCELARIGPGRSVAILGLGPIGLMAVEQALLLGAAAVFAIDPVAERRARAAALGATAMPPEEALLHIREATHGRMTDSVLEAAGSSAALSLALDLVGREGVVGAIGVNLSPAFDFPYGRMFMHGVTLAIGTCSVPRYYPALVPLVQRGRLRPEQFISTRMPLETGGEAYALLGRREAGTLKTVLTP